MNKNACPCCQQINTRLDRLVSPFVLRQRCQTCGHSFALKQNEHVVQYSNDWFEVLHLNWFRYPNFSLFHRVAKTVLPHLPMGARVLDIGCSRGEYLSVLKQHRPDLHCDGIDLCLADSKDGLNLFKGNFLHHDFGTTQYDLIISAITVELFSGEELQGFHEKVKKLLRPKGWLVISASNEKSLVCFTARVLAKLRWSFPAERMYHPDIANHFNPKSLSEWGRVRGWNVTKVLRHNMPVQAIDSGLKNKWLNQVTCLGVAAMFAIGKLLNKTHEVTVVLKAN